ncbi:MAG: S8 family peptidase [Taibaiella sp.]|nr:S8 family peptidase [Taibaiella sp.]
MKKPTCKKLFSLVFLAAIGLSGAYAQQKVSAPIVRLKGESITMAKDIRQWMDSLDRANLSQPCQVLMHFDKLPGATERAKLESQGIALLDYVPDNSYIALVYPRAQKGGEALTSSADGITGLKPEWKADKYLWNLAREKQNDLKILVHVVAGTTKNELANLVSSLGGKCDNGEWESFGYYNVIVPPGNLRNLAGWYAVRYISPAQTPVPLDKQSIPAVKGSNALASPLFGGYGLNGDGVTIGIGDNTTGAFHIDVADRVTNFNPAAQTNHGIHINCIAGGAAILDPLAQSMAPKASLLNFFFSDVLAKTGDMLAEHNMTITNNSYTVVENDCAYFGTYDLYSRLLDSLELKYPTVQHVFAAGNDGELTCTPYPAGYGTLGGGYQPSKNSVVVGSMSAGLVQAFDQSRGPVKDGRIRPDVVAVGYNVYSGLRNNTYGRANGTSMASPQVASGLAVLTQQYKRLHGGEQPKADLLKTILISAAMDLGNPGPDYSYGFGMMDIGRSLQVMTNDQYFVSSISNSDSATFTFNVPANSGQAKVTLCWNDQPASPLSSKQLVNDLDIVVRTPSGERRYPLVLNPAAGRVQDLATEQADHLNNVEQVTINTPQTGTYTIVVLGHNVPFGPQPFVVAYDLISTAIELTYPHAGERVSNTDSFRVFWNSIPDGHTYGVDLSVDDGSNWATLANNISADAHLYNFIPTNINSGKCRIKLRKEGTPEYIISGRFAINAPPVATLYESQCPGYVNIHWSPVPGATQYEMLLKRGAELVAIDTTGDTTYSFSGLPLTLPSIVAVQPLFGNVTGYRSKAIVRIARDGDCASPSSTGDLMLEALASPGNARMHTTGAPINPSNLSVRVRNLYNSACGSYRLSYRINGAPWMELLSPGTVIPANGTALINISGASLNMPGNNDLEFAIENLAVADPEHGNDTLRTVVKFLPNNPINLVGGFADGFEDLPVGTMAHDSIGISSNGHWDYFNDDDSGRLRPFVTKEVVISGQRSMSMDQVLPMHHGSNNQLIGTFNLGAYSTATEEVRVDFDYMLHGNPASATGNIVTARGNDTRPWVGLFSYDLSAYPGYVRSVKSLSLTDAVRASGSNFSTSTQISFGQNDTTVIAGTNYGTGITIDNFKMYTVQNDVMLSAIVSPGPNNCGLPNSVPLTVTVKNGVNGTLHNIEVFYRLDGGPVLTGMIDSIRAKDSINFSFPQLLNIANSLTHKVDVWLSLSGDSYKANDSLLNYEFRNSKIIASFPYIENFENGDGGYYTGGFMSSWQYGTPTSPLIDKAATGNRAWKTNLSGRYNNLETSYLYSPCFDISGLGNPTLSFSLAQDLENCGGVLCDGAYMEYSFDGETWVKLGQAGEGYNWYDSTFVIWNTIGFTRWHVATIALPKPGVNQSLHLRFVMFADPAVTFEGLAVDDIHIYDLRNAMLPTRNAIVERVPDANTWNTFVAGNQVVAGIEPTQLTKETTVNLYRQDTVINVGATQYVLPRSYLITSQERTNDCTLRLYLSDSDVARVAGSTECPSCPAIRDAYSLGITQYYNSNEPKTENNLLSDDTGGTYIFNRPGSITWLPFDKGYVAEFNTDRLSEYWFNNGGPGGRFDIGTEYLGFLAYRKDDHAKMEWHSLVDSSTDFYVLERSADNELFDSLARFDSQHRPAADYSYEDATTFDQMPVRYYRLRWQQHGLKEVFYSPARRVGTDDGLVTSITFDATIQNSKSVLLEWTSHLDGLAKSYDIERAVEEGSFSRIATIGAVHRTGQRYGIIDTPQRQKTGTTLRYRLTATMQSGETVVPPIRSVSWVDENAIIALYPNPTSDGKFTIEWNADPGSVMKLQVTDITGRILEETAVTATNWTNKTTVQTQRRAQGLYLLKMSIGEVRHTAKLLYE